MNPRYFHSEFFPTPDDVIDQMVDGVRGKKVLEPSCGSGRIVKRLLADGAEVIACEIDNELRKIVETLCPIVASDFFTLTAEQVSHIDIIIMNPPFSNADKHILQAYKIAPDGCRIVALANMQTVKNPYSRSRTELETLINSYGSYRSLGNAFDSSDRKTDVEVALIIINKPGGYDQEFAGFFTDEEDREEQVNGLMSYNAVRDLVNRYVESIKIFDQQLETAVRLQEMTGEFFVESGGERDGQKPILGMRVEKNGVPYERNRFKKDMQKSGWRWIFEKMNLNKYSTEGLKQDINKFVETQLNVPFTMRNIYKMLEIVVATTSQRMDKALLEVFDKFTKHHHENRFGVEGWQTNSHYLINKRFITGNYAVEKGWHGEPKLRYGGSERDMDDFIKALCFLTGTNYDDCQSLYQFVNNRKKGNDVQWGEWTEWKPFFRLRCYKKGSLHLEFIDEKVWAKFNQHIARLKGYPLAEKKEQTKWQKQRAKATY